MGMQQFFGPGRDSPCAVIDEGDYAAKCRRRAFVAGVGQSRLQFDKVGEIGKACIPLSEALPALSGESSTTIISNKPARTSCSTNDSIASVNKSYRL
jgi:hypothetical protein